MPNATTTNRPSSINIPDSSLSKPNECNNPTLSLPISLPPSQEYTETLTPFECKGLQIAKDHLGPSFDMKRSSGFIRWKDAKMK